MFIILEAIGKKQNWKFSNYGKYSVCLFVQAITTGFTTWVDIVTVNI